MNSLSTATLPNFPQIHNKGKVNFGQSIYLKRNIFDSLAFCWCRGESPFLVVLCVIIHKSSFERLAKFQLKCDLHFVLRGNNSIDRHRPDSLGFYNVYLTINPTVTFYG